MIGAAMVLLILLAVLAQAEAAPGGAIEATVRGTAQPLDVELFVRAEDETWQHAGHKPLPASTRVVRFDGLHPGVYQLRVSGDLAGERLAMKVGVGRTDVREVTIDIRPRELTGRVTLGGTELGAGALFLRHKELGWEAGIPLGEDGSFRAPFWQSGSFTAAVRSPAMTTSYSDTVDLGEPPWALSIDIPDGRIRGVVRDAKSGAPAAGVTIALQTNAGALEHHVSATSDLEGRFDFTGIKYGRHIVRIRPALHLEPEPVEFELDATKRLHELDVPLEAGRTIPLLVVDSGGDPVEKANVFAIGAGAKLCARAATDQDGRASIAVPEREPATLFVLPPDGGFGVLAVARDHAGGRLRLDLPPASSSLLIRARTTTGGEMPRFSLLMRYGGALLPREVAEELRLSTGAGGEVRMENIPSGTYEFWPYRTDEEAEAIALTGDDVPAPIRVEVREGENRIAVKFAAR